MLQGGGIGVEGLGEVQLPQLLEAHPPIVDGLKPRERLI